MIWLRLPYVLQLWEVYHRRSVDLVISEVQRIVSQLRSQSFEYQLANKNKKFTQDNFGKSDIC